jgi:tellurite resistance protein
MEALVAACAIMAHADGEVASAERRRLHMIARSEPRLAAFSYDELAEEFAMHEANFRLDPELARAMAMEKIEPVRARPRDAQAIVDAGRQIIPADGVIHPAELRALVKIRRALGIFADVTPNKPARKVLASA